MRAVGHADDISTCRRLAGLDIGGRVANLDHDASIGDSGQLHCTANQIRRRTSACHFIARHRTVDHTGRRPTEPIEQDIENRPAEAVVERHLDAVVVQRREYGGGAVDLAHIARVPVALDHPLEEYLVDVVRQCAGVIAAVAMLLQQRLIATGFGTP